MTRSPVAESVSVVIPTRGDSPYLREAIASVQTQEPAETIVVENGGATLSEKTLDGARLIQLPEANRSLARNAGVAAARFPFVAFLDDDDVALPERLARQHTAVGKDAVLTFGRVRVVDDDGTPLDDWNTLLDRRFARLERRGVSYEEILAAPAPIYTSATLVRREAFLAAGGYDPRFDAYEDLDLYLRLARAGEVVLTPGDSVAVYRLHGQNTPSPRLYEGALGVTEKHLPQSTGRAHRLLLERRLDALWGLGRYGDARRAALRAALEQPLLLTHPRFAKRFAGSFVRR
jgi:glycosyltransferase involved in cell wall biosynthesis